MSARGPQCPDNADFRPWLTFFGVATAGTALIAVAKPAGARPAAVAAAAIVVAVQLVYWFLARPSLAGTHTNGWRAWVFTVVAVAGFATAVTLNSWAALVLIALLPEIFLLLTAAPAAGVIVALNLAPLAVSLLTRPANSSDLVRRFGIAAVIIALSLFYASRMQAIMRQSQERQRLIDELHEREAEITALSAARGAEQERARIARDTHDTLAQGFTSIIALGRAALGELGTDPATARRHIELITANARENLAESRRIIAALSPSRLMDHSLPQALARVIATYTAETGLDAVTEIRGTVRGASPAAEVVVLRIVQEALANVRKHANADRVNVTLEYGPDALTVEIRDDGTGFDPAAPTAGFGLAGMRSRVAESGGAIQITSRPGAGTAIRATLPTGNAS